MDGRYFGSTTRLAANDFNVTDSYGVLRSLDAPV